MGSASRIIDVERECILATLQQLVEPLCASIVGPSEVVVHDLDLLPNSIIAVSGSLTGRTVGDPATDALLKAAVCDELDTRLGYRTTSPDGKNLLSTTIIFRDSTGAPVAALCINRDITQWEALFSIGASLGALIHDEAPPAPDAQESFVHDVDELAALLLHKAVEGIPVPVDDMRKEHKVDVVRRLKEHGFFLLRDAASMAAEALRCTRFSIYNYLNEIDAEKK